MDWNKRLNEIFKEVTKVVPTIVVIGRTNDDNGLLLMNSNEKSDNQREEDLSKCVASMMSAHEQTRNILLASVCYFMQMNPDYQQKMINAINIMRKSVWN